MLKNVSAEEFSMSAADLRLPTYNQTSGVVKFDLIIITYSCIGKQTAKIDLHINFGVKL